MLIITSDRTELCVLPACCAVHFKETEDEYTHHPAQEDNISGDIIEIILILIGPRIVYVSKLYTLQV